jgi:two-component system sensor histidine kinase/response regulator
MGAFRSGIQQKILLLLLTLALPPLLFVGWLGLAGLSRARATATEEGTSALRMQAEAALARRAIDKAELYDAALTGIYQQVQSTARYAERLHAEPLSAPSDARVWVAPAPDPELIERYQTQVAYVQRMIPVLQTAVASNPLVNIGYIGLEEGGVIAFDNDAVIDNLIEIQPFDPRTRPWYVEARTTGDVVWTDAYVDANTGTLATTCAVPIYGEDGTFIGVVAFDVLLSTITEDLLMVDIGQNGYAFLINAAGDVLVRPDLQAADVQWDEPFRSESLLLSPNATIREMALQLMQRRTGILPVDYEGQSSYIAFAPIETAGWSVALVIPASEIIEPALVTGARIAQTQDELQNQLLILLAVMVVAISSMGWWMAHSFSRRIRAVQQGVQAVAGGRLDARLPAAGSDEIGQLVETFNMMTGSLQEKVDALEDNARLLATLNTVSNELKSILDLDELLETIPARVCTSFGFDRAALYLVDGDLLRIAAASFGPDQVGEARRFIEVARAHPLTLDGSTVEADVVRSGKAVIVDDPWENPSVEPEKQAASSSRAYVQVPIFGRHDQVIGVLSADYQFSRRSIQAEDAGRLLTFASVVGLSIENTRLYADLERQVSQRTEELREALERVQLADRRKSDFLASMSHELRTPLNAIIGFSNILFDGIDGDLSQTQREDVRSINRNGRFLLHLINDLLDLAKIEAGHLSLHMGRVDMHALVVEVADTLQALLRDRRVVLRRSLPQSLPPVWADADRMRQILLNLLANAVKFTEEGTITIAVDTIDEVNADNRIGRFVLVRVTDTGVGIPPERQQEIFEDFVQLQDKHSRVRGTGLGLAIVRRLVEAHAGRIWVLSVPGEGSTFSFTVPVAESAQSGLNGNGRSAAAAQIEPQVPPAIVDTLVDE